jgi:hypothetical protein
MTCFSIPTTPHIPEEPGHPTNRDITSYFYYCVHGTSIRVLLRNEDWLALEIRNVQFVFLE